MCNEQTLPHDYDKKINNFTLSWFNLRQKIKISTTPKIHILLHHLRDYFNITHLSLRKTTDEVIEVMHQFMHKRLSKGYWVKDISNPNHGKLLLKCVKHVNCYNLRKKRK